MAVELKLIDVNKGIVDDIECRLDIYEIGNYEVEIDHKNNIRCDIYVGKKPLAERYVPEIYYEIGRYGKEPKFKVQTTSYGSLELEDIRKVAEMYQEAVEVVEILTKMFI